VQKTRRPTDADAISPQELQKMCQNILYLLTTTVDVMEPVSNNLFTAHTAFYRLFMTKK